MAEDGEGEENEPWEKMRKARRLQELYHGRFTQRDAIALLDHHDWDIDVTVDFTLSATTGQLREILDENTWQLVERAVRIEHLRDSARSMNVPPEFRQFACEQCDNVWWRKVPVRKLVSRCRVCKIKFDALPRDKEYGWAVYICPCENKFHGFGAMGKTLCLCFRCNVNYCMPDDVLPPLKRAGRRTRNRHSCTAPNCFNRTVPEPYLQHPPNDFRETELTEMTLRTQGRAPMTQARAPIINLCVHPKSLHRKVVEPSTRHVSTGSTVKTFLTQDELMSPFSPYEPSLVDIDEIPDN